MTKAVGYTRLSQESDRSIDDQKRDIEAFCQQQGFDLVNIFDDGRRASGFDNDRPQYQSMLERVREGDIGAIVVRDRSRISRDKHERMSLFNELTGRDVDVYIQSSGERVNVSGEGFVMEAVHGYSDDDKKREEIERAKKATRERIEDGCFHGRPPFGLRFAPDDCHLEPDPDEFETVEAIISKRSDGETVVDVADHADVSTATVSRVANRGLDWYREKLDEYGVEGSSLPTRNPG